MRSVTTREPAWTEHDTALLVALAEYRDGLCDCCGYPKKLVWSDLIHERDAPRITVARRYCRASRTLIESQHALSNQGKDVKPEHGAIRWSVLLDRG